MAFGGSARTVRAPSGEHSEGGNSLIDLGEEDTVPIRKPAGFDPILDGGKAAKPTVKFQEPEKKKSSGHGEGGINDHDEEGGKPKKPFVKSHGLTSAEAERLLLQYGRNELVEIVVPKWRIFVNQLIEPMPIMIWLAAIVELAIANFVDFGILMCIQFLNAGLSFYETTKAGDAVAALKASLKPLAVVKRDGKVITMDAALLVPGDMVILGSGGAVPADCIINEGTIDVDQAALTGESLPVTMHEGDEPKMGSTVVRGETEATVGYTGSQTFLGKTAAMLQGPPETSNLQKMLIQIMAILVVFSITLCLIVFIYLTAKGENGKEALSFTVVLLIASIPVAIEIVCTTTLALGSSQLAQEGAIVSRLAAIEDLSGMTMLCSDKTGTLTLNKMVIQDETPVYKHGETQYTLLRYAAMAAKWKEPARDALDTLVFGCADLPSLDKTIQTGYMPFDPTVKRTEGTVTENGVSFKTTKGAPHVILKLVDNEEVHHKCEADVQSLGERGIRAMAVAKTNSVTGAWEMLGLLTFLDPPRPDTKATIHKAIAYGVSVKMITGDHLLIAKETSRQLEMGTAIYTAVDLPMLTAEGKMPTNLLDYGPIVLPADGFAQVFPEHKFLVVEILRQLGHKTGMTGDGVNDAPALKQADVGVAVQGATDAARAAADIVLTRPGLSTIVEAIVIARIIFQRMKNFLTYRIAATLQLLVFFFIAVLGMHPRAYAENDGAPLHVSEAYPKFFKMPVLMLMLITLLNDGTLISIGYDTVTPSALPQRWNLPVLFTIAGALGLIAMLSSVVMLHVALGSWNPDGFMAKNGLGQLHYGQITTMIYLKVSISDFLTLFSARTLEGPFWSSKPSPILLGAGSVALIISTIIATAFPADSELDEIETTGLGMKSPKSLSFWVWVYCILCWFIQDAFKVVVVKLLEKYNVFGINDTAAEAILRLDKGRGGKPGNMKNPLLKDEAITGVV